MLEKSLKFSNTSNWKEQAWKKNSGLQRDSNPWPPRYRCSALSVGRASHRCRGGHGFESRWSPDFFLRLLLSNYLNWKINCDDHSSLSSTTAVQYTSEKSSQKNHHSKISNGMPPRECLSICQSTSRWISIFQSNGRTNQQSTYYLDTERRNRKTKEQRRYLGRMRRNNGTMVSCHNRYRLISMFQSNHRTNQKSTISA